MFCFSSSNEGDGGVAESVFVRGVLYVTVHDVKDICLEASMLSRLTGRELHLHGTYAKVIFLLK